ncbi:MAG: alpha/beta fold hydrolase [Acidobacteriaceae bacterium]|nr:alpha/beta fold hydrolase [Acidobacteriaceae bacterium]MBV9499645.1 alpha/beta fold hydrolase [Acidobacteriaceae bacterium]
MGRLRVLYLHGFASGPRSRKATFLAAKLRELGFPVEIPDLAQDRFESLTITGQLSYLHQLTEGKPAILIGSSLGGYLAALYAARHPEIDRLLLLAPAFGFHQLWVQALGPERLAQWRSNGTIPVFHYAENRDVPIGYQLMEDAGQFEPFPDVRQPVLILHGNKDTVVPVQQSVAFVRSRPNARVIRLESGHELTDVLDNVWKESESFLLREPKH